MPGALPALAFREALSTVASAVSVAATVDDHGRPCALTISSFSALSLRPPLVSFSIDRVSRSHPVFATANRFAVTVLASDQENVARRFAGQLGGRHDEPLDVVDGLPVVPGGLAYLLCTTAARLPGGDHTILIGEVHSANTRHGLPLVYYRREYTSVRPAAVLVPGSL